MRAASGRAGRHGFRGRARARRAQRVRVRGVSVGAYVRRQIDDERADASIVVNHEAEKRASEQSVCWAGVF